jgi:AICAR transformylase/IMP cyclohydrolase PurH
MGCGQTSRVDACRHAIAKAYQYGFDLMDGAVMASDAFFPFPDCVALVNTRGYKMLWSNLVVHIKDQLEHRLL